LPPWPDSVSVVSSSPDALGGAFSRWPEFQEEEVHLWTFNDSGKVFRFWHYADTVKHIEAAGLA
jgi:hypothetical protein